MKKYVVFLLLVAIQCSFVIAQVTKSLSIGDSIPSEIWLQDFPVVRHPDSVSVLRLESYKDKLVILDFWATWCGPCIQSLNKLDTLQRLFKDKIVVVPITYENAENVQQYMANKNWSLFAMVGESYKSLKEYFPFKTIPHQVWLKDGCVYSIPYASYATKENISRSLDGMPVDMLMKEEDMGFDAERLISGNPDSFFESGFLKRPNVSGRSFTIRDKGVVHYNASLIQLIQSAYRPTLPFITSSSRIVLELSDSTLSKINPTTDHFIGVYEKDADYLTWRDNYTFLYYNRFSSPQSRKTIYVKMQRDIEDFASSYFNVRFGVEERNMPCWVIKKGVGTGKGFAAQKDGVAHELTFINRPFSDFIGVFRQDNYYEPLPIINEAPTTDTVTLRFESENLRDFDKVAEELARNGYELVKEDRLIDVMVLREL